MSNSSNFFGFRLNRDEHPKLYDHLTSLSKGKRSLFIRNTLFDSFNSESFISQIGKYIEVTVNAAVREALSWSAKDVVMTKLMNLEEKVTTILELLQQLQRQGISLPEGEKANAKSQDEFVKFEDLNLTEQEKKNIRVSAKAALSILNRKGVSNG